MPLIALLLSCSLLLATPIVRAQNTTTTRTTTTTTTTTTQATTTVQTNTAPTKPQSKAVTSTNDFAVSLYKAIGELSPAENLFLSPLSVSYGLAMLYAAAGGQTRAQLATALNLTANTDPRVLGKDFRELVESVNRNTTRYALQLASCLFANKNFKVKSAFLSTMNETFGTVLEQLDLDADPSAARARVNEWVADRTSGIIKNVFVEESINSATTLVLANAAYFKGFWLYAFGKNATKTGKFTLASKKVVSASMMHQQQTRDLNYANSTELGCEILELPYDGLLASMYIFLPHTADGLAGVESRLTSKTLAAALASLKEETVRLTLPKFAMDRGTSMMQALGKLGVADLFDPSKADLSGFDGSKRRALTDIVHKAYVSVDEEGKIAAAVPAFGIIVTVESVKFSVNRPFLFLVCDKSSGSVLFIGRVAKPLLNDKQ